MVEYERGSLRAYMHTYEEGGLAGKTVVSLFEPDAWAWVSIEHEIFDDLLEADIKYQEFCRRVDEGVDTK